MKRLLLSSITILMFTVLLGAPVSASSVSITPNLDIPKGYELVKVYDNTSRYDIASLQRNHSLELKVLPDIIDDNTDDKHDAQVVDQSVRPLYDLREISTGEIVTEYAADVTIMGSSGTKTADGYDSSISVYAKATIYYIFSGSASEEGVTLDKVDWRYEIKDSTVKIKSKSHLFVQDGPPLSSGPAVKQRKTLTPTDNSGTDLVRNWGWVPLNSLATSTLMGVDMTAELGTTYDSSTWKMNVKCMIIGIV
ncbi:hypothetical protein ACFQ3W_15230 [Paenibacillus puldeungensis]|uniref:Uncharacterized protein n=1 Tax=Paenibacillus puldeungensis TaxID=696536 RepID=A0ABW3RZN8_9BACL